MPVVHAPVPIDRIERSPTVEAELQPAVRVLAGNVIAVLVFHERGSALRAVSDFLIVNACPNLLEVESGCVASALVVLGFAELAEDCVATLASQLLIGHKLGSLTAFCTEEVQLEYDFVRKLAEILEVQPPLQLDLVDARMAPLNEAEEVLDTAASRSDPTLEVLLDARLTELVAAVLEGRQISERLEARRADLGLICDCFEAASQALNKVEVVVVLEDAIHG